MRFISKSSNLLVVLSPGLQAQPLTGSPAKPTVSVRFKDGVADVPDGKLTKMMLAHPGLNGDFVSADSLGGKDPYSASRSESEPAHDVTEMKFGTPISRKTYGKVKLPPEFQKIVQEAAVAMAKEMLPEMVKNTLKSIVEGHEAQKEKRSPGRPPKELTPSIAENASVSEKGL